MADWEQRLVAGLVVVMLGASYVAAVAAFATEYLLPATVAYLVVAAALVVRVVTSTKSGPD